MITTVVHQCMFPNLESVWKKLYDAQILTGYIYLKRTKTKKNCSVVCTLCVRFCKYIFQLLGMTGMWWCHVWTSADQSDSNWLFCHTMNPCFVIHLFAVYEQLFCFLTKYSDVMKIKRFMINEHVCVNFHTWAKRRSATGQSIMVAVLILLKNQLSKQEM